MSALGYNFATVMPKMSRFTDAGLAEDTHPAGDFSCWYSDQMLGVWCIQSRNTFIL